MITEIVILVVIVAVVALWGLRSIVRGRCCGGSNPDEQTKCGQCPAAAESQCQEDDSCAGRGLTGGGA